MADQFIDRVYSASGDAAMQALYDDWADQYDRDVLDRNYVTPKRVADALSQFHTETTSKILDFGCGSGLSGTALIDVGFTEIDGADISEGMLDVARRKGVYKQLWLLSPNKPLPFKRGDYQIVAAAGAISVGAAPGAVFDQLVDILPPSGLLVFSLNDKSRAMEEYAGPLRSSLEDGKVRKLFEEHGPHIDHGGEKTGSTIYVLERLG